MVILLRKWPIFTVTGITEINNNLTSLGSKLEPNRVATAAQFLGHSVLIPGQVASPDDNGEIHGVVTFHCSLMTLGSHLQILMVKLFIQ